MGMTIDNVLEILEKHKLRIPSNVFYELKADIVNFEEPTTQNDLGVTSGLEKNSKKLEKNFGELDCISREQALKELKESAEHHTNDSREEVLLRRNRDIIRALPSVAPGAKDVLGNNAGEILDKIRAEIKELHDSWHKDGYYDEADALAYAMKVIDKYKAECEVKNGGV